MLVVGAFYRAGDQLDYSLFTFERYGTPDKLQKGLENICVAGTDMEEIDDLFVTSGGAERSAGAYKVDGYDITYVLYTYPPENATAAPDVAILAALDNTNHVTECIVQTGAVAATPEEMLRGHHSIVPCAAGRRSGCSAKSGNLGGSQSHYGRSSGHSAGGRR